jgi:hypothetical protein
MTKVKLESREDAAFTFKERELNYLRIMIL